MPEVALVLYGVWLALAFLIRVAVQWRRTGSTGVRGLSGPPGSVEWLGGAVFLFALMLGGAAPVLDLEGTLDPIDVIDGTAGHVIGLVLAIAGIVTTFAAQEAMGASWRIGVEEDERTELVTTGPFRIVRNPIYSAMLPTVTGLALLVPNAVALLAFILLVVGLEIQTRLVEEPYLLETHGESYAAYARRVGRFAPGVGRLRP